MDAIETLKAYANKKASQDDVMRALTSHAGYFVPAAFMVSGLATDRCDKMLILGQQGGPPDGELWLFTDEQRAREVGARGPLGPFGGPFDGARVFAGIDPQTAKVKINPVLDVQTFWFMGREAIPLAKLWAAAITVERAFAGFAEPDGMTKLVAALRSYEGFQVFGHANGAIVTAVNAIDGFKNAALVFTAPDCAARAAAALELGDRKPVVLSAEQLFTIVPRDPTIDGMIFNICGPGTMIALPPAIGELVLSDAPAEW
jgi:hypothetical protein